MRRFLSLLIATVFLAGCHDDSGPLILETADVTLSQSSTTSQAVPNRYIVVFKPDVDNVPALARGLASAHGGSLQFIYQHAVKGFSVQLSEQGADALRHHPSVAYVEQDQIAYAFAQEIPTGVRRIFADGNANLDIDGTDDYRVDVDIAIIDTGIDLDHPDLNVVASTNCSGGSPFRGSCGEGGDDDNGHGTHVAGTVAALDNGIGVVGVAPGARLLGVKVLRADGSGYISWIVAGIDWVTARADRIEVANMSLGCECSSQAMDDAISSSVAAGVVYAVAAGNSNKDAKDFSPASHPDVITVSALADFDGEPGGLGSSTCRSDQDDTLADFSNWGSTIEIAAPGVCITSTYPGGDYRTYSGTSMASPHAAGAAALLASGANDPKNKSDVDAIIQKIVNNGNFDWTDDSPDGTTEPLLDVSNTTVFNPALVAGSGSGGGTTDNPPSVSITSPADGATVSGTVTVTADASDDSEVTQVEFFVDGSSIGVDSDGSDGWSASWATTDYADGGHTLKATATDNASQSTSHQISVTVDNSPSGGIMLTTSGYKIKGLQKVDLEWSGATSTSVDVYRDGAPLITTDNDGFYTDNIDQRGGGSYTYKICEAGTDTCSNEATVTF